MWPRLVFDDGSLSMGPCCVMTGPFWCDLGFWWWFLYDVTLVFDGGTLLMWPCCMMMRPCWCNLGVWWWDLVDVTLVFDDGTLLMWPWCLMMVSFQCNLGVWWWDLVDPLLGSISDRLTDSQISSDLQVGESTSCGQDSWTRQVKLSISFLSAVYKYWVEVRLVYFILSNVHRILYTVHCTLYTAHCTL